MPKYYVNADHVGGIDDSHEFDPILLVSSAPFGALEDRTLKIVAAALRAELVDTQAIKSEVHGLECMQGRDRKQKRKKTHEVIERRIGGILYEGKDAVVDKGVIGYGPRQDYFDKALRNDALRIGLNVDIHQSDAEERAREWDRQGLYADRSSHKRQGLPAAVAHDFKQLTLIEPGDVDHLIVVDGLLSGQEAARFILDILAQEHILPDQDAV